MSPHLLSTTACSVCGEPLDNNQCIACLLRAGLDETDDSLVLGDFEIECREDGSPWELGSGAMGVTYRARDKVLNRTVALKVISTVESQTKRDRFVREARSAAALKHPNVAGIFQFGASPKTNRCYYAMELVEGETLEALVRRDGPLKLDTALDVAIQVTRALVAAATQGLVHRDLKPGNIMITGEKSLVGTDRRAVRRDRRSGPTEQLLVVKVIDFGLAKATNNVAETDLTHGEFVGTPTFASPEQFAGSPADARSDIYSLGVTLWYALTGEVPYAGKTIEQIRERQQNNPLPVQQLSQRRIPTRVIAILKHTLAIDPAKRPASAQALLTQLEAYRRRGQKRRMLLAAAAAITLALGLLGIFFLRQQKQTITRFEKSVAVLPFDNLSDDKENAFFADGVQDDILVKLAKISDLKVISRGSVMQYRGKQDVRQIGNALRVSHVLEGTVRRLGSKLHVNAQLVDTRTDQDIWADEYDRDLNEVFAIETEVAQSIANRLRAKVSTRELAAIQERPTSDLVAYDHYVRAVSLLDKATYEWSEEQKKDYLRAVELFNQAIARDANFFLAYCRLAEAHDELAFREDDAERDLTLAKSALDTVFRLKPDAGEAHLALAIHFYHGYVDYAKARNELAIALRTLPNNARIFEWSGYIDRRQGRWNEAARALERAIELDPQNVKMLIGAATTNELMRNYPRERAIVDRLISLEPNNLEHRARRARIDFLERADIRPMHDFNENFRGILVWYERNTDEAENVLTALADDALGPRGLDPRGVGASRLSRPFVQGLVARMKSDATAAKSAFTSARALQEKKLDGWGPNLGILGLIDAALGQKEEALQEGRQAVELARKQSDSLDSADVLYLYAVICAWTGERDLAIEQLKTLAAIPAGVSYGDICLNPYWDSLRGDPRFEKIVASLRPNPNDVPIASVTLPEKSIAVLPFANLSDNKENGYFASGIQDETLSDLARIADLKVISRTSVAKYNTNRPRNIREIGQALGVANILEGSVQRSGNRIRVVAQLIDARTDKHTWSETYDRDLSDVFAVQSEIAQTIAEQLHAKLSPSEKAALQERPTKDLNAYSFYLRATALIDSVVGSLIPEKDLSAAVDLLNEAVKRDPSFLLAYCRLAEAHDASYFFTDADHTPSRLALAKSAIDSAFQLKPDSGEAHLALALHFYRGYFDYEHARAELALARRALPNNPKVYQITALIDRRQGRWPDALRNFQRASELDPRNVFLLTDLASALYIARAFDQADKAYARLLAINPNDNDARICRAFNAIAWRADTRMFRAAIEKIRADDPAFAENDKMKNAMFMVALFDRDFTTASRIAEKFPENDPTDEDRLGRSFSKGLIARMEGDAAGAYSAFTSARAEQEKAIRARPDDAKLLCGLGLIDAGLGRKEEALREGRRAVELMPVAKDSLDGPIILNFFAQICAWTGERDLAIEQLQVVAKTPSGADYGSLRLSPMWDPLRGDPRFEKLVASLAPNANEK